MKDLRLKFLHLCETVVVDNSDKLSIINIFESISTSEIPFSFPVITVVGNIEVEGINEDTKLNLEIKIKNPSRKEILQTSAEVKASPEKGVGFATRLVGVPFKEYGEYSLEFLVDGKLLDARPLKLIEDTKVHG